MRELTDELEALSELDELRDRAQRFRGEGMAALEHLAVTINQDVWDGSHTGTNFVVHMSETMPDWQISGDAIEAAMLVRVLRKSSRMDKGEHYAALLKKLNALSIQSDLLQMGRDGPQPDVSELPVLVAARAMQALVATSTDTFSTATMLCYYRIIRELYIADSPDWNAGGARAGAGGEVTAYITAECIRAVLMLERSFLKTAEFFRATHEFYRYTHFLKTGGAIDVWSEVEGERAALDWYISMAKERPYLALKLPQLELAAKERFTLGKIDLYFEELGQALHMGFEDILNAFTNACKRIDEAREKERKKAVPPSGQDHHRYIRSISAHEIAYSVIDQAKTDTEQLCHWCETPSRALQNLEEMAKLFEQIAHGVQRLLAPAARYIASVLDHELTSAAHDRGVWDVRELAFAAGAYGALTQPRKDERLVRACQLLTEKISEDGFFPRGRPFHSIPSGLRWETVHFEVCRALSELLQQVDLPMEPKLIKRMLDSFEHLSVVGEAENLTGIRANGGIRLRGWHMEDPPIPRRPTLWVTGHAVLAVDKMVRMLDGRINDLVLKHFSTKQPEKIEHRLEDLFYPDYGRKLFYERDPADTNPPDQEDVATESIGITLQRMRAHIVDVQPLPGAYANRVHSSVLHGPPGTGKTTLLEALAKSSNVPLIQMSPSDIAVKGPNALEARARATFVALSMLTRVVIILDEFESVLSKRDSSKPSSGEFLTFLTPGMLPKLTRLYDEAKKKRVAYVLVTNHLEKLDDAAIRPGRFDHRLGIYMPDPVSRAGLLMCNLIQATAARRQRNPGGSRRRLGLNPGEQKKFEQLVVKSGGLAPVRLAKRYLKVMESESPHGGGNFVLDSEPSWRFPDEVPMPTPADRDAYGKLNLLEEKRLNAWERALRETPTDFQALLRIPGPYMDRILRRDAEQEVSMLKTDL